MSVLVGRQVELDLLNEKFASPNAEMIFICGRRRVGKSALVRAFCKDKRSLTHLAVPCGERRQLEAFGKAFCRAFGQSAFAGALPEEHPSSDPLPFESWEDALRACAAIARKSPVVLVIDDFDNIAKARPAFASELQKIWDWELSHGRIKLILCTSDAHFLVHNVIGAKCPLFMRAATLIKLEALDFQMAAGLLPSYSTAENFLLYAVLGGFPFYYEALRPQWSAQKNLACSVLASTGLLNQGAESLLASDFKEPEVAQSILSAIACGARHFSDIARESGIAGAKLSESLADLEEAGVVKRELCFGSPCFGAPQSQVRYRLKDRLLAFWLRFVGAEGLNPVSDSQAQTLWKACVEPAFEGYAMDAFVDVCREYLVRRRFEPGFPVRFSRIERWWNETDEIDLVAVDARGESALAGQCWYRESRLSKTDKSSIRAVLDIYSL